MDLRESYRRSLVHYLKQNPNVQKPSFPEPFAVLQDLYRIIVNTYIERDLNTIELRLEQDKEAPQELFKQFLDKLYIMRRRIAKYEGHVSDQLHTCRAQMWSRERKATTGNQTEDSTTKNMVDAAQGDFEQVQQLLRRNLKRTTQSLELITSLISLRESGVSITQNQRLGFLTMVATIVLPFNAVAAIFGIQGNYGPDGPKFWIFWVAAASVCVGILLSGFAYHIVSRKLRR